MAESIAAITQALALLSGLTADLQTKYKESYTDMHASELIEERDGILNTMTELLDVASSAKGAAENVADPDRYRTIVKNEQLADKANAEFNTSFVI